MSEQIEHKVDRTNWPTGPWDEEPEDKLQFEHVGLACLMLRNNQGAWCGYVGVPAEHAAYEKSYNAVDVDVHGGLTYEGKCAGAICHVPAPGMPDDVWWLGFDTSHWGDEAPGQLAIWGGSEGSQGTYRTQAYVMDQTRQLAEQLKAMEALDA